MTQIFDCCAICNRASLVEIYPPSVKRQMGENINSNEYKCTSMSHYTKPMIVKCSYCKMIQIPISMQPINLLQAYEEVVDEDYLENLQIKRKTFSHAFKNIKKYTKENGSLLEIGSYCGIFLAEAENNGQNCTGIEPSRWAVEYARKHLKSCSIINLPAEEAMKGIKFKYDVIVSWDVIEHVQNPLKLMNDASTLLNEGGYFIFSTILIDSWIARIMGRRWHWIMNMHLYYFSKNSIQFLQENSGFKLIESGGHRHYASLRYAFRKICNCFPEKISSLILRFEKIIPNIVLPFTMGDVKYYVMQKTQNY